MRDDFSSASSASPDPYEDGDLPHPIPDDQWVPDSALSALQTERTVHGDESEELLARRLMRENLPQITMGLIHTAIHDPNSRVRLDAQKYVMERVLGRVGDDAYGADTSPIAGFIDDITEYVAQH